MECQYSQVPLLPKNKKKMENSTLNTFSNRICATMLFWGTDYTVYTTHALIDTIYWEKMYQLGRISSFSRKFDKKSQNVSIKAWLL